MCGDIRRVRRKAVGQGDFVKEEKCHREKAAEKIAEKAMLLKVYPTERPHRHLSGHKK